MLTRLTIRNFKCLREAQFELADAVVFVGPSNSGKTSALQALALWGLGVRSWIEKYGSGPTPKTRPGLTISSRDLFAIPHASARHLWYDQHIRHTTGDQKGHRPATKVRIEITIEGIDRGMPWRCGLEFGYVNPHSIYCRPLRIGPGKPPNRMPVPKSAVTQRIALLPPMSGLANTETRLDKGVVNVRVGEGRTAEVLRNLCYSVSEESPAEWRDIVRRIQSCFGVVLQRPHYIPARGELVLEYEERGTTLELSSSGRGLQQTLLILTHLYANPESVILLDEPYAHFETFRQRQTYRLIGEIARETGSQSIAATHSEVILNEAAGKDLVIAFVGRPHWMQGYGTQVRKALREIAFDHYLQAERTGWVLYLEEPAALAILRAFARRLGNVPALQALAKPFVHYVGHQPEKADDHFHGLREACPDLLGIALFNRLGQANSDSYAFELLQWRRREIGNYLCTQATLEAFVRHSVLSGEFGSLFTESETAFRLEKMHSAINAAQAAMQVSNNGSPWDSEASISNAFLTPLFKTYYRELELHNEMDRRAFHRLVPFVPDNELDPEITEKLNAIARIHEAAQPRRND